jgi:hypothetical protein
VRAEEARLRAEQEAARVARLQKKIDNFNAFLAGDPSSPSIVRSINHDIARLEAEIAGNPPPVDSPPPPPGGEVSLESREKIAKLTKRIKQSEANITLFQAEGWDYAHLQADLDKLRQELEQEQRRAQAPAGGGGGPPAYQPPPSAAGAAGPPAYQPPQHQPPPGPRPPAYEQPQFQPPPGPPPYEAPVVPVPVPEPAPAPTPLSDFQVMVRPLGVEQVERMGAMGISAVMLSRRLEQFFGLKVEPEDLMSVVGASSMCPG